MSSTDSILQVSGISLSFKGVKAINELSFDVRRGEICALIGPNGVGNSATLKAISGLVRAGRAQVSRGVIEFLGHDTACGCVRAWSMCWKGDMCSRN